MKLREKESVINTALVIAPATGIVKSIDKTLLVECGSHLSLTVSWAKSLLKRMKFTKCRGTTKTGISVKILEW